MYPRPVVSFSGMFIANKKSCLYSYVTRPCQRFLHISVDDFKTLNCKSELLASKEINQEHLETTFLEQVRIDFCSNNVFHLHAITWRGGDLAHAILLYLFKPCHPCKNAAAPIRFEAKSVTWWAPKFDLFACFADCAWYRSWHVDRVTAYLAYISWITIR
jgi:hypothetical protein